MSQEIKDVSLQKLQMAHKIWLANNFPNNEPVDALLGLAEEVGELAHAFLKRKQGIRTKDFDALIKDAVGDILIFLVSFCNTNNINLCEEVHKVWEVVSNRNWIEDPIKGGED